MVPVKEEDEGDPHIVTPGIGVFVGVLVSVGVRVGVKVDVLAGVFV